MVVYELNVIEMFLLELKIYIIFWVDEISNNFKEFWNCKIYV